MVTQAYVHSSTHDSGCVSEFPALIDLRLFNAAEKLSPEQAGHLRHFHNLASQEDGQWGLMGAQFSAQEWVDGYRYQLATMAYAAGAAHYHRLPALRSCFKKLLQDLISKMLRPEVWSYWFNTSHSGKFVDPDIKELRKPWADPIVRENIMYSGHLLHMVSLYTMLFNDTRYDHEGALSFHWSPVFWGMGPETFSYNRKSLQTAILSEFEREGWLGSCCEPNSIFVVCNQFPIIGMRYNDIHDGTDVATQVTRNYAAAWADKGMVQEDGLIVQWWSPKQKTTTKTDDIGSTAWAGAFMNAWNPELCERLYRTQRIGFLSYTNDGRVNLNSPSVAVVIRDLVENHGADPYTDSTRERASDIVSKHPQQPFPIPFLRPTFGYVAQWISELGDTATLSGLLKHADTCMKPTWMNGGLYYKNVSHGEHEHGNWVSADPFTGNAALGYARLNIFSGQKKMWQSPWTTKQVDEAPFVDELTYASNVDVLRAFWDEASRAMVLTLRMWNEEAEIVSFSVRNLPTGRCALYTNGMLSEIREVTADSTFRLTVEVGPQELDLVLLHKKT